MHDSRLEFLSETNRSHLWFGLLGASAYVIGFVATYVSLLLDSEVSNKPLTPPTSETSGFDINGLFFYTSHNIDIVISDTRSVNAVDMTAQNLQFPEWFYLGIPIAALVFAGFQTVDPVKGQADDAFAACVRGSLITVGYFPMVLLGAMLFSVEHWASGDVVMEVPIVDAAVIGGLAYPIAFGALGACLVVLRS